MTDYFEELSAIAWLDPLRGVQQTGAYHLPRPHHPETLRPLLAETMQLPYQEVEQGVAYKTQLRFLECKLLGAEAINAWPEINHYNNALGRTLREVFPDSGLQTWQANSVVTQIYRDKGDFITSHQDYAPDRGVIAILTLCGAAHFQVLDGRAGEVTFDCLTAAGSLVLLRAPGLMNPHFDLLRRLEGWVDPSDNVRPFHRALPPLASPRVALVFRMALADG